jgi:tetratricopeptide (TPR) repeat protein
MLRSTISIVKKEIDAGKNIDEILKADVLKDWSSWGEKSSLLSADAWTRIIFFDLRPKPETVKVSICKPLTRAIVEEGIEAAVKKYQTLKAEKGDLYDYSEPQLNILGYQLVTRKMMDEAIEIFKLNVKAYPNSSNVYDSLGETYATQGNIKLAIEFYKKALERDTENVRIKNIIKNLVANVDK